MTGISLFLFDWMEYVVNVLIDDYGVGVKTAGLDKVVVPDDTSNHRRKYTEF